MAKAKKKRRVSLTTLALVALGLYHAGNLFKLEYFHSPVQWQFTPLSLREEGKTLFSISVLHGKKNEDSLFPDFVSLALSRPGFLLRYMTHNLREEVILGKADPVQRFYLREEVQAAEPLPSDLMEAHYLAPLRQWLRPLEASRIAVTVLPVPPKLAIERSHYPSALPGASAWEPAQRLPQESFRANYDNFLKRCPAPAVDLFSAYESALLAEPKLDLYVPTDSHWSSYGVAVAAQAIARYWAEIGILASVPQLVEVGRSERLLSHDLTNYLSLPRIWLDWRKEFQWEERFFKLAPAASVPHPAQRLVFVGTSYGARLSRTPFGLGEQLAAVLGRALVSSVDPGGGQLRTSLRKLQDEKFAFHSDDIVLMEFAFRQKWRAKEQLPPLAVAEPR